MADPASVKLLSLHGLETATQLVAARRCRRGRHVPPPPSPTADNAGSSRTRSPSSSAARSGTWTRSRPTTSAAGANGATNQPQARSSGVDRRLAAEPCSAEHNPAGNRVGSRVAGGGSGRQPEPSSGSTFPVRTQPPGSWLNRPVSGPSEQCSTWRTKYARGRRGPYRTSPRIRRRPRSGSQTERPPRAPVCPPAPSPPASVGPRPEALAFLGHVFRVSGRRRLRWPKCALT